jgi:hypothetical protein
MRMRMRMRVRVRVRMRVRVRVKVKVKVKVKVWVWVCLEDAWPRHGPLCGGHGRCRGPRGAAAKRARARIPRR